MKGNTAMTRKEQKHFVTSLLLSIKHSILEQISSETIPPEWDGIELRQLIADKMGAVAYIKMKGARLSDYRNTVIVNNL